MILDVILLLIFGGFIFWYVRRGAVKALSNAVLNLLSYLTATIVGQLIANFCYHRYVEPAVQLAVTNSMKNISTDAAQAVVESLPDWLTAMLGMDKEALLALFSGPLENANTAVLEAVNQVVYPITMALLAFFITILLFFALYVVGKRFAFEPMQKLFRLKVTDKTDRILGGVIGFIEALLLVCMLTYLTKLIVVNIGTTSTWLNAETINKSFIFKFFYHVNIFAWIGSAIMA